MTDKTAESLSKRPDLIPFVQTFAALSPEQQDCFLCDLLRIVDLHRESRTVNHSEGKATRCACEGTSHDNR